MQPHWRLNQWCSPAPACSAKAPRGPDTPVGVSGAPSLKHLAV